MSSSIVQQAVIHTCNKRGWASFAELKEFVLDLAADRVESTVELRRWFGGTRHGNRVLADRLLTIMPKPGHDRLGNYHLWFHLADGAAGTTWLASGYLRATAADGSSSIEHHLVVVKQPYPGLINDLEGRIRFEREIGIGRALLHEHIVRTLDSGQDGQGLPYVVLAYVDGGDLRNLIERRDQMPEHDALVIIHQAAQALELLHRTGIIHRDIKPANIFLTRNGEVKLGDFGAARTIDGNETAGPPAPPHYRAPEGDGRNVDGRSDIYSLGVCIFQVLAGYLPFNGMSSTEVISAHQRKAAPDLRTIIPGISRPTAKLVAHCLAKVPEDRCTAAELIELAAKAMNQLKLNPGTPISQKTVEMSYSPINTSEVLAVKRAGSGPVITKPPRPGMATPLPSVNTGVNASGVALPPAAPEHQQLAGELPTGASQDWLILTRRDEARVVLFARRTLTFGRLQHAPTDLTLRLYPSEAHVSANTLIGRQHAQIAYIANERAIHLTDLKSSNGTTVDGKRLIPNQPYTLAPANQSVVIGKTVSLNMKTVARRSPRIRQFTGGPASTGEDPCGIDNDLPFDGVIMGRIDNRMELSYGLVLRCLSVGGPEADLPIAGATQTWILGRYAGRWLIRAATVKPQPWRPLALGSAIAFSKTLELTVVAGTHHLL